MIIRNLTAADYDQVIGLYKELDDFHVQRREGIEADDPDDGPPDQL